MFVYTAVQQLTVMAALSPVTLDKCYVCPPSASIKILAFQLDAVYEKQIVVVLQQKAAFKREKRANKCNECVTLERLKCRVQFHMPLYLLYI